jgi:subtilisin family serine protease
MRRLVFIALGLAACATVAMWGQGVPDQPGRPAPAAPAHVRGQVERQGLARVIVELDVLNGDRPEPSLAAAVAADRRRDIAAAQARVITRLAGRAHRVTRRYERAPYLALEVSAEALDQLEVAGLDVTRIFEDTLVFPSLSESVPLVQGDQAWLANLDGAGQTIAIIDSGVDAPHPFLSGKIVDEACYSANTPGLSESLCPNGAEEDLGPGAGAPCQGFEACLHGTHVAGIAAGNGSGAGVPFSGVARAAQLMAIQAFSRIIDSTSCGGAAPCLGAWDSDLIAGLERVYARRSSQSFASVNMSLGGGRFTAPCDDLPYKPTIDNLRAAGIASVIASGNSAYQDALSAPGCVSSAVSVGSTSKTDVISFFGNRAWFLALVAPGESIMSSVPGGGYRAFSGTSMATPHVAGAWAVIKQAIPTAGVDGVLSALQATGAPVTGIFGGAPELRIRIYRALGALGGVTNPAPSATSLSPDHAIGGSALTLEVIGSGFVDGATVRWNGADRPTTVVNTTRLRASIPASDTQTPGIAQVSAFMAAPGGGTSASLPFTIAPGPALSVAATTVNPGEPATVTLTNGLGNANDWLAFAATGAADNTFLRWTYVGAGVTTRTWTVTAPTTAGTYEFRFYPNGGYTRMATSPAITVPVVDNRVPSLTALSPASAIGAGPGFTLTVSGSGFVSGSTVRWTGVNRTTTFVSATQLRAQIPASDIATPGSASVTVFSPQPGGGTSGSLPFTIKTPPVLTVSATTVNPGSPATVTLTNGLGNSNDWLAFAATDAPVTTFSQWTYVGAGVTTRTWTVTAPATSGSYEFRYFLNGSYTINTRSPSVTIAP